MKNCQTGTEKNVDKKFQRKLNSRQTGAKTPISFQYSKAGFTDKKMSYRVKN